MPSYPDCPKTLYDDIMSNKVSQSNLQSENMVNNRIQHFIESQLVDVSLLKMQRKICLSILNVIQIQLILIISLTKNIMTKNPIFREVSINSNKEFQVICKYMRRPRRREFE
jgi:hypothetical protein